MTYPDSVQFLYALGNEMKTAKLGLQRIRAVLDALGNPERAYRVVHVAGTNGKGSTCAMIAAGLQAAGVRTGLFTSPHLVEPTERIQIDGLPVSEMQFSRAFDAVHQAASSLNLDAHPSYFETVAAMAFWLFREFNVQTAVIEVGLGGRLDATNVVDPALTVITAVDLDHQMFLGDTIAQIAAEKAGILKRGVPAVFAPQKTEAEEVLESRGAGTRNSGAPRARIPNLRFGGRRSRKQVLGYRSPSRRSASGGECGHGGAGAGRVGHIAVGNRRNPLAGSAGAHLAQSRYLAGRSAQPGGRPRAGAVPPNILFRPQAVDDLRRHAR